MTSPESTCKECGKEICQDGQRCFGCGAFPESVHGQENCHGHPKPSEVCDHCARGYKHEPTDPPCPTPSTHPSKNVEEFGVPVPATGNWESDFQFWWSETANQVGNPNLPMVLNVLREILTSRDQEHQREIWNLKEGLEQLKDIKTSLESSLVELRKRLDGMTGTPESPSPKG